MEKTIELANGKKHVIDGRRTIVIGYGIGEDSLLVEDGCVEIDGNEDRRAENGAGKSRIPLRNLVMTAARMRGERIVIDLDTDDVARIAGEEGWYGMIDRERMESVIDRCGGTVEEGNAALKEIKEHWNTGLLTRSEARELALAAKGKIEEKGGAELYEEARRKNGSWVAENGVEVAGLRRPWEGAKDRIEVIHGIDRECNVYMVIWRDGIQSSPRITTAFPRAGVDGASVARAMLYDGLGECEEFFKR